MNLCIRLSLRAARLGAALVALAFCAHVYADVRLPNGEYTTTIEDLKVKVIGGYVTIARSWTNGRWYANPQWADLKFTYDSLDGSVRGIDRAGTIYERTSAGLYVYKIDQPFYILKNATGWRWYDPKGNWVTYDPDGHLTAYGDRNVQVTFTLDGSGRHTQVQDQLGQLVLSLQYTGDQLTGVTDRAGRQVRYQYTSGNLTQVIDVLGNASSYTYDSNGQLTSLTDQEGHTTTVVYAQSTKAGNAGGGVKAFLKADSAAAASVASTGATPHDYKIARVFTVTDPEGNTTTYLYDYDRIAQRFTVTQKFPGGRTVMGVYDVLGRLRQQTVGTRIVSTMTRDGDRTEMVADERGLVTTTAFDGAWNPITVTYPDGTSISATYDSVYSNVLTKTDEAGTRTTYQYDVKGNLTQMTEAVASPEQRVTIYTYDQYGQRLSITRKGATMADDATTVFAFDKYGNVASITSALAHKATYAYDVMGNALTLKDPRGNSWAHAYNDAGWLLNVIDPLNHATTFKYDKVGNTTARIDPLNNTTAFSYNRTNWLISTTDPQNGVTRYQYDAEGRKTKDTDQNNVATTYEFDTDGRLIKTIDASGNATRFTYGDTSNALNGLISSVAYPTYTVQYRYDQRKRRVQVTQVLAATGAPNFGSAVRHQSSHAYDGRGNVISETDPSGRVKLFEYDALRQLVRTTDPLGGVSQYTYDLRGNLVRLTDANGHTQQFFYDLGNRRVKEVRPSGRMIQFMADENGNLATRTNPNGEQRRFTYDLANRRIKEEQFAVSGGQLSIVPSRSIDNTFDPRNLLIGYDDGTTSATYDYDTKGQKRSETINYGAFSKTIQYEYQANGKRTSFTYPDGFKALYTYDTNTLLQSIVTPSGIIAYGPYQWNAPLQINVPGVAKSLVYDPLLRVTEIRSQAIGNGSVSSPQGAVVMDSFYSYDVVGNITQRSTIEGDYVYAYDALDRLIGATPPPNTQVAPSLPDGLPVESYVYDGIANRLASQHQPGSWAYDEDSQLLSVGQGQEHVIFDYDLNGSLSKRTQGSEVRSFAYDAAERLIGISNAAGAIATYYYDPAGRRLSKTVGNQTTYFQYADEGLVAEYDASGSLLRGYGWRPGGTWGTNPLFMRTPTGIQYYQNDHLGTPQRLIQSDGTVTWSAVADAFGATHVNAASTVENPLRFAGQYFDQETGLHYNKARYFDPVLGRYLMEDRLGVFAGPNVYAYALGNPVVYIDPSGLLECTDWSPDFDTSNCTKIGFEWKDEPDEQMVAETDPHVYWGWTPAPRPKNPPSPEPDYPEPGRGPGGRIIIKWPTPINFALSFIDFFSYVDWYYDEWTVFERKVLITTETWSCTDGVMCRTSDETKKRSQTCRSPWFPIRKYAENWTAEWHSWGEKPRKPDSPIPGM